MITNCSNFNPVEISTGTWAFGSSTCEVQNPTSSIVSVSNGFTHGEAVLTTFIFLIFLMMLFGSILKPFWGRQL